MAHTSWPRMSRSQQKMRRYTSTRLYRNFAAAKLANDKTNNNPDLPTATSLHKASVIEGSTASVADVAAVAPMLLLMTVLLRRLLNLPYPATGRAEIDDPAGVATTNQKLPKVMSI